MKILSGNESITIRGDRVFLEGVSVEQLLEKFPPPLVILLESRIRANCQRLSDICRKYFSSNYEIFYSVKSNYTPTILKTIKEEGLGFEIVSLLEWELLRDFSREGESILAGGPYNHEGFLQTVIESGVKRIVVQHLQEIPLIEKIARRCEKEVEICLRIKGFPRHQRFGVEMTPRTIETLKNYMEKTENICLAMIQSHLRTQNNQKSAYLENCHFLTDSVNMIGEALNIERLSINMGGGLPEAVVMTRKHLNDLMREIGDILKEQERVNKIVFEPGRYIVGDAGVVVAGVHNFNESKREITVNIGNHICPKFSKSSYRFYNLDAISEPHGTKTSIYGIIPTEQDVLAKNYYYTSKVRAGSRMLVTNAGAYGITFSYRFPYKFPRHILIQGEQAREIALGKISRHFF